MIFASGKDGTLAVILAESDIELLRTGGSVVIGQGSLFGNTVTSVTFSLAATDQAAIELVREAAKRLVERN